MVDNKTFENLVKFTYLGMMVTNQNYIHEKIKSRLTSGNACWHAFQNLSICLKTQMKIQKTVILRVVLYGCQTWSLTLWDEH
jgi:hypothetical protein